MPKTKLEIIEETEQYYSDASKRGGIYREGDPNNLRCKYITPDGKMCAVGRCMIAPKDYGTGVCGIVYNHNIRYGSVDELDELLKEEYRGHDIGFWESLQMLHDINVHFKDGTWSDWGLAELHLLKEQYA